MIVKATRPAEAYVGGSETETETGPTSANPPGLAMQQAEAELEWSGGPVKPILIKICQDNGKSEHRRLPWESKGFGDVAAQDLSANARRDQGLGGRQMM